MLPFRAPEPTAPGTDSGESAKAFPQGKQRLLDRLRPAVFC